MIYKKWHDTEGMSKLAIPIGSPQGRGRERKIKLFGLLTHLTGRTIVERAIRKGMKPIELADKYYTSKKRSVQFSIGLDGTIHQYTDDREYSYHIGVTRVERLSYLNGDWRKDFPKDLVNLWDNVWDGYKSPTHLFPGKSVNDAYSGVELLPCVGYNGEVWAEPMSKGLWFTKTQHDSLVALICDTAKRWNWSSGWNKNKLSNDKNLVSPRLPGHEDVDLYGRAVSVPTLNRPHRKRHTLKEGWDPGGLRLEPYLNWPYIYSEIEHIIEKE